MLFWKDSGLGVTVITWFLALCTAEQIHLPSSLNSIPHWHRDKQQRSRGKLFLMGWWMLTSSLLCAIKSRHFVWAGKSKSHISARAVFSPLLSCDVIRAHWSLSLTPRDCHGPALTQMFFWCCKWAKWEMRSLPWTNIYPDLGRQGIMEFGLCIWGTKEQRYIRIRVHLAT